MKTLNIEGKRIFKYMDTKTGCSIYCHIPDSVDLYLVQEYICKHYSYYGGFQLQDKLPDMFTFAYIMYANDKPIDHLSIYIDCSAETITYDRTTYNFRSSSYVWKANKKTGIIYSGVYGFYSWLKIFIQSACKGVDYITLYNLIKKHY